MSTAPLEVGLVGAGGIAQAYASAIASTKRVELVSVADPLPDRAREMAERMGCKAAQSHRELLASGACDAVVICTPPATHPEIAIECLDHGMPVLCEKPLAIASADARRMLHAAAAADVPFTMASKFRYTEDVGRARTRIAEGCIGDVILFEVAFAAPVSMAERWNAEPRVSGGGVLIDNGTHAVDIIRYLAGPIAEVLACEGRRVQPLAVEDTAQMFVRTATGAIGHVDLSWSLDKGQAHYLQISGSEGIVRVGWQQSDLRRNDGSSEIFGQGYDKVAAFRHQIEDFASCVQQGTELRISPEDALSSVEVIEAAYRSIETHGWERVREGLA